MKRIFWSLVFIFGVTAFAACTDTKDCVCEVNTNDTKALLKTQTIVSDWDGDCSKIDAGDVPGWNGDPCTEQ